MARKGIEKRLDKLATPDVPKLYFRGAIEIHLKQQMKVIAVSTMIFKICVETEVTTAAGSSKVGFTLI